MIDISKKTRLLAWLSAVPFLIVIFLFEILPLLAVATNSVFKEDELSFGNYIEILLSKFFLGSFRVSFSISAATAMIALWSPCRRRSFSGGCPAGCSSLSSSAPT